MKHFTAFFISLLLSLVIHAKGNPKVVLETNKGSMTIELYKKKAPATVENFLEYVNSGFYNGTIFHRVIDGFMIQGGGFTTNLQKKKTRKSIINEATNKIQNTIGTIAMARTSDVNSATAQFFINVADNDFLNHRGKDARSFGYAVFGRVVKGMSVVNQIKKASTKRNGPFANLPVENIIIKKAKVMK